MEEQRGFSRGRFLRLSAMTAGGLALAGCNLEQGGGPPGAKRGGSSGEDVDFGKIQAAQSPELEKLAEASTFLHDRPWTFEYHNSSQITAASQGFT
jgi:hypothetical protein